MDIKNFTVRNSGALLVINIIINVILLFFFYLMISNINYTNSDDVKWMLIFTPIFLFFPFYTFFKFRWKIVINDDQITVRPCLGRKMTFTFDYITILKHKSITTQFETHIDSFIAYSGSRKLFTVTSYCPNYIIFIALLKAKGVNIDWGRKDLNELMNGQENKQGTDNSEQEAENSERRENNSAQETDINSENKNAQIERLEKLFDSTSDEKEKSLIAKQLYELGIMYYWRFMPRDK